MYIVCWMNKSGRSYWSAFDDHELANAEFNRVSGLHSTYTATMSGVIKSTDYYPISNFVCLA